MSKLLVSDELWAVVEPLLPEEPPKPKGGRPRMSDRAALTGSLFVRQSGIPWEMLAQEMGCGSGMTWWRRLRDWQQAGVWGQWHHELLRRELLRRLPAADKLDGSRAALDAARVPATRGASRPAPPPASDAS